MVLQFTAKTLLFPRDFFFPSLTFNDLQGYTPLTLNRIDPQGFLLRDEMQEMRKVEVNITEWYFILLAKNNKCGPRFELALVGLVLIQLI